MRAKELGAAGEEAAARFLAAKGYLILTRGYRKRGGEIDLIARDGQYLVFVEVKSRRGASFGRPAEAVTPYKQKRILRMAALYLQQTGQWEKPCRFDVMEITLADDAAFRINHIINAFTE